MTRVAVVVGCVVVLLASSAASSSAEPEPWHPRHPRHFAVPRGEEDNNNSADSEGVHHDDGLVASEEAETDGGTRELTEAPVARARAAAAAGIRTPDVPEPARPATSRCFDILPGFAPVDNSPVRSPMIMADYLMVRS